jgi:hypothetical protein
MRYCLIGIIIPLALGLCVALVPADAQRPAPVPRLGFLGMDSAMQARFLAAFQDGLHERGYVEGQTIAIVYQWAEGRFDRLPDLAAELEAISFLTFRANEHWFLRIKQQARHSSLAVSPSV